MNDNKKTIEVIKDGKKLQVEVYDEYFAICGGIWVNAYIPKEKMYCKYYKDENGNGNDTLLRMVKSKDI